ncbi:MAG TPA: histone deacetylase [Methanomicrobiales archaeon]|nr:histone deacetylase [Methanomicrobiales archaeon]
MQCEAITGEIFCRHHLEGHPESRDRLRRALSGVPRAARRLDPVKAGMEDLTRVHTPGYLAWLQGIATGECYIDFNTYICPDSYEVALHAAGSAMLAADEALDGHDCFALVRPPGHHAGPGQARGYCLLNNVAVAAARALGSLDRVAIVDWDLHHGNGTQEIFYASDRVLFCSVHQAAGFPGSGGPGETGTGPGRGYTLNAPLEAGCGPADYRLVFSEVFCPALERFGPDLLLVSAGQDSLADDPKAAMRLLPGDYGTLTRMLRDTVDLPLALALEGGYGPSLGPAVRAIFRALGGRVPDEEPGRSPARSTEELVRVLKRVHVGQ